MKQIFKKPLNSLLVSFPKNKAFSRGMSQLPSLISVILHSPLSLKEKEALLNNLIQQERKCEQLKFEQLKLLQTEKDLIRANGELLRFQGLFSVRGMLEYIEDEERKDERNKDVSRGELFFRIGKSKMGMSAGEAISFGNLINKAYNNYNQEIHEGKRSPQELNYKNDTIIINQSPLVNLDQCLAIEKLGKFYRYPCEIKKMSKNRFFFD
jgi:hypothetical protein